MKEGRLDQVFGWCGEAIGGNSYERLRRCGAITAVVCCLKEVRQGEGMNFRLRGQAGNKFGRCVGMTQQRGVER